jgi:hypothetical protein
MLNVTYTAMYLICPYEGARMKKEENAQRKGKRALSVSFLIYSSVRGK